MISKEIAISLNTFIRHGGMENYTLDLVRQLHADGHQVHVYANKFAHDLPEYAMIHAHILANRHVPKKLRPFTFTYFLNQNKRQDKIWIACNDVNHADILVCGSHHAGFVRETKTQAHFLDKLMIYRQKQNYQTAKRIMAHSALIKQEIIDLFDKNFDSDKIHVIYPPVDTQKFTLQSSDRNALKKQYGFQEHETVFLFPSTGHQRKGLPILAEFFEQTQLPVKLAVAGSPLPRPMKNVVELGYCRDMPALYHMADYTMMASQYEPFGLVGVESVLCGTRVIFSKNMGCCEILNEDAGFFFERNRLETLAQAIEQALALKEKQQHKLTQPMDVLQYNPSLSAHIQALYALLETSK